MRQHRVDTQSSHTPKAGGVPLDAGLAHARAVGAVAQTVVLVEGASDQVALEALANRTGRDLAAEGVAIVPIGGTTTIGYYLDVLGPAGLDLKLAGLCDAAEEGDFQRGLERVGLGRDLVRTDMEALGFFVCDPDLEVELITALGAETVVRIVEAAGESAPWRSFQLQPEWRGRTTEDQLRRFMGTRSGRKIRYGRLLVEALDLEGVPRPLRRVLAEIR